jgi:hypothetical protein
VGNGNPQRHFRPTVALRAVRLGHCRRRELRPERKRYEDWSPVDASAEDVEEVVGLCKLLDRVPTITGIAQQRRVQPGEGRQREVNR